MNHGDMEDFLADDPSDEEEVEEADRPGTPVSKRRRRNELTRKEKKDLQGPKIFQTKWLTEVSFKGWLEPVKDDSHKAFCRACQKTLQAGKSDLERHAKTAAHTKAAKAIQGQAKLDLFDKKQSAAKRHTDAVKTAEIQIAAFFADKNIAFQTSDDLVAVQKKAFPDSTIVQDMTLGRDKCGAILRNVIAKVETEELVRDLRENLFSIMVDESTDSGREKNLIIMVDYMYPAVNKPRVTLLELIRLNSKDCSAAALWSSFEECLARHLIPVTNIVGLSCDGANVMVGAHNSFWSRLKTACPWAILLLCACHSAAKVSAHACSELPSYVETHLRMVSSYMTGSPKRSAELEEFQEFYEEELKKIIKPSGTRWLVLHSCVVQYLQIQKSLKGFFELRVFEDSKDRDAAKILQDMKNPYTIAYMHFLDYALNFLNEFNGMFQGRQVLIHKLADKSLALMKNLCQNYLKPSELSRVATINVTHPDYLLPLQEVYLGPGCNSALDAIPPLTSTDPRVQSQNLARQLDRDKDAFRLKCLAFYQRSASEIQARLPLNNLLIREMAFLDPAKLLSQAARVGSDGLSDLPGLVANFKDKLQLNPTALALEWRRFPNEVTGALKEKLLKMPVEEAWAEISLLKNHSDQPMFSELSKLASVVQILPHSNAESERGFSIVTDVKSKKRNRLGVESLNAICVARTSFRSKSINCATFQVREQHLEKHNVRIYDRNKK